MQFESTVLRHLILSGFREAKNFAFVLRARAVMECFRWFNYKLDSYPHIEAIETIFLAIILPDVDGRELRAEGHETRSIRRGRQNCVAL